MPFWLLLSFRRRLASVPVAVAYLFLVRRINLCPTTMPSNHCSSVYARCKNSSWRSCLSLDTYLQAHHIVGIQGIDTRALTTHLRDHGSQQGCISHLDEESDRLGKNGAQAAGVADLAAGDEQAHTGNLLSVPDRSRSAAAGPAGWVARLTTNCRECGRRRRLQTG